MPTKDAAVKEAILEVIGTSRIGRKKIVVKVQKKHPHLGASKIRRFYQKEGFSLNKRFRKNDLITSQIPLRCLMGPI